MNIIHGHTYKPKFVYKKANGLYPSNLFMGYEMELIQRRFTREDNNFILDYNRINRTMLKKVLAKYNFLYAKYDESCELEINTQPFNLNWFYKKNALASVKDIVPKYKATRDCGFHIHLSRSFFSEDDLTKMVRFFYANTGFIRKISQRGRCYFFNEYATPYLRDNYGNIIPSNKLTKRKCKTIVNNFNPYGRWSALNLCPSKTVEIRIFQGTTNKKLILAYLEFCVAVALYTKRTKFEKLSVKQFIRFIKSNKKYFKNLLASKLWDRCKYKWNRI